LAVERAAAGKDTFDLSSFTMYPLHDWRGNATAISFANGYPAINNNGAFTPPLPAELNAGLTAYRERSTGSRSFAAWMGSLMNGQIGASGLEYRRNRYYDPMSGRFTQEDPIGLAGGMNLYGFAAGDAINHTDPFGLCPNCFERLIELAEEEGPALESAVAEGATAYGQRFVDFYSNLGRNLTESGFVRGAGEAAHHIVAKAAAGAEPAREVLAEYGVKINSAVNGVFLPAAKDYVGTAANHLTLHTNEYYERVNQMLSNAQSRQDVVAALAMIRDRLLNGKFP
jgi:RHS repeat-associated protein